MQALRVFSTRHKADMPTGKNKVSNSADQQIIFINTKNQIKKKKKNSTKGPIVYFRKLESIQQTYLNPRG